MPVDTVIRGGTLVTPTGMVKAGIAIADGTIVAIGKENTLPDADRYVDATGYLIMPGIVDPHTHIDDLFSIDTIDSGTAAAALGGVTTCINFAWQAWTGGSCIFEEPGTLSEAVERQKRKSQSSIVDYGLHAVITREIDSTLDELPDLVEEGVTSFKMFTCYDFALSNGFIHRVFDRLAELGGVALLHTEDRSVCNYLGDALRNAGKSGPEYYPLSRPDYAEAMAADDAVRMAVATGVKYYGVHTSSRKAAEVIAGHQQDGSQIRAETCTQYTALDESIHNELGMLPLIAPPLRIPDDIDAMFEYLKKDVLSVVSTDHVAYSRESKDVDAWWESPFGTNGLQTSLPVFHHEAVNKRGLSYPFLVRVMSSAPAKLFGMAKKGTLQPGADADIVIFDPSATQKITSTDSASNADYTLYEGREVTGRVEKTFVRGKLVADDGEIVTDPGHGQFIVRERPDWRNA